MLSPSKVNLKREKTIDSDKNSGGGSFNFYDKLIN